MNDDSLERIESKIAHLERAAAELSDVVFRQHEQIRTLESQLEALKLRFSATQAEGPDRSYEQERPPHY